MRIIGTASAIAEHIGDKREVVEEFSVDASCTFEIDDVEQLDQSARDAIILLANREAERVAQIAAVNLRDQKVNRLEAERIRKAPKNRPHIIVGAGTRDLKDPASAVTVVNGSYKVAGKTITATTAGKGDR